MTGGTKGGGGQGEEFCGFKVSVVDDGGCLIL